MIKITTQHLYARIAARNVNVLHNFILISVVHIAEKGAGFSKNIVAHFFAPCFSENISPLYIHTFTPKTPYGRYATSRAKSMSARSV